MGKSRTNEYKWKEDVLVVKDICFECGSNQDIHYHHIVPEIKGGTKTIPLCVICHGKVHNTDFLKLKELLRIGMEKAKARGVYFGRPLNTKESDDDFMLKEKSQKILQLLSEENSSIRKTAKAVGCSINLVIKVKRLKEVQDNKSAG